MTEFAAKGKFLITGEYLVLHGARALAMPLTKMQQRMSVGPSEVREISWKAFDENDLPWFSVRFSLPGLEIIESTDRSLPLKLRSLLDYLQMERPNLFRTGLNFETHMNFSPEWGLGSSSTLVSVLAQWSEVDAYEIQKIFFQGSGYDIACATALTPVIYHLEDGEAIVEEIDWTPPFKDHLYFYYLGKKQDTRDAMLSFKKQTPHPTPSDIQKINELTQKFQDATDLRTFQTLMREHEAIIGRILNMKPIKDLLFSDFPGEVKSLGGWGGDFVMVASETDPSEYFTHKGYELRFKWKDLIR